MTQRFHLQRDTDHTGVSGTGTVADGVIWPDGTATLRWRGKYASTVHWASIGDAKAVHGHGGDTRIVLDDEPTQRLARIAEAHQPHIDEHGGNSGYCAECQMAAPCPTSVWATAGRDPLACWDPDDEEGDRG